jgi:opacity protein-like surface antigen
MKKALAVTIIALLAAAPAAVAKAPLGLHGGFSFDPDQVVIGGHVRASAPYVGWIVQPSFDLGFGDHVTSFIFNGDMLYTFPELQTSEWGFYAGAGLALAFYELDLDGPGDDSRTEVGLNLIAGVTKKLISGNELMGEFRLGVDDIPDVKLLLGITFF